MRLMSSVFNARQVAMNSIWTVFICLHAEMDGQGYSDPIIITYMDPIIITYIAYRCYYQFDDILELSLQPN